MSEESQDNGDKSCNFVKTYSHQFHTAILDEDLKQIEDISKKYGSDVLIRIQDGARREVFGKGHGILPLHLAASYRREKSMRSLLSMGADPEMRDGVGRTTLHLVIASWPSSLTTWAKAGSTAQIAVTGILLQAEACLRLLCESKANVNAEVKGGNHQTALHLSVRYAALSAVHILASYGANVNAEDKSGMTPLHMAAGILHKDIITSLIKEGADINRRVRHSGNTPLHLAAVAMALKSTEALRDGYNCICKLLEHGAEADAENRAGKTALQEVCSMGNEELADLLLSFGASVNKRSNVGENCLFLFLNHRPNVTKSSLLEKLFSLTSPLTIYNHKGHLPSTLMLPCFFKQRQQILRLMQQPRSLQDMCKSVIYFTHGRDKREDLRKVMPDRIYDFVFHSWNNLHISFERDEEQDSINDSSDNTVV